MQRRDFIKQSSKTAALTFAAQQTFPAITGHAADQPPNVLFIICDQMRGDCMSGIGHPNVRTPHIDKLADEGVLLTHAFCNGPVCVPSRMSMFAGKYPHQTGRLSNKNWGEPLLSMEGTLTDYFIQNGYRTGWVGKNHTYQNKEFNKLDTVSIRAREPMRKYSRWVPPHWHSDTLWQEEDCHPRKNTDEAIAFMQNNKTGQPFFLHVSYFDPHPPYMAPAEFTCRYCSADMKLPDSVKPADLCKRFDEFAHGFKSHEWSDEEMTETLRYYYASIEWGVDYQVGRLMNALEANGLRENTIVVFTADHGDFMGYYGMVRKSMFLYDCLLHVPLIFSAPGKMGEGIQSGALSDLLDLFPTLVDYTGGEISEELEGKSLRPVLEGNENAFERSELYTSGGYGQISSAIVDPSINLEDEDETPLHTRVMEQSMTPNHRTKMIRNHDWKLILNEDDEPELYNLDGGHYEQNNVINSPQHTGTRHELERKLSTWWEW